MSNGFLDDMPDKFLNGENQKDRHKKKPKSQAPETGEDDMPVVIYQPVKCPRCKSENCPAYKTIKPIRYRKCSKCGYLFKSVKK